jgi:hypothetical protein
VEDIGKRVVTFLGFGELGYENQDEVAEILNRELDDLDPRRDLVATGTLLREGGLDGIAVVYEHAKQRRLMTIGIHPSVALGHAQTHRVSPHVDVPFYVEDRTWGGFLPGTSEPSPTLRALLLVSDVCVVVGGGKHAADEMRAFVGEGVPTRYHVAQLNHAFARRWSETSGQDLESLDGAAHRVWNELKRQRRP